MNLGGSHAQNADVEEPTILTKGTILVDALSQNFFHPDSIELIMPQSVDKLKPSVFISHSSKDKAFVRKLVADLKSANLPLWFDEEQIGVGDSIVAKINDGLASSVYVLAVLSKSSIASSWVQEELNYAKMRSLTDKSVVILPVILEDCEVPPLLMDRLYADFRKDYSQGLTSLMSVLEQEKLSTAEIYGQYAKPIFATSTCTTRLFKLKLSELQKMLDRFSRPEIASIWFGLFEKDMDDDLPRSEKIECIIKLLSKARDHDLLAGLIEEMCYRRPNL